MTREEILQLIADELPGLLEPVTKQLLGDVKAFMDEQVHPLADKVDAIEKAKATPTEPEKPAPDADAEQPNDSTDETQETPQDMPNNTEDNALMNRVKLLEQQIADANKREQEQAKVASDMRFNTSLSSELDKLSPVHKGIVQELLANRLRNEATEDNGTWLTKDGKTLTENVSSFFASPEGMHFLPSKHVNGVGATETTQPKTGEKVDLESAIMAAFL